MDVEGQPPVDALIASALAAPNDSDERWENIRALQRIGGSDVFARACELARSDDHERREVGVDVLAQLGPHESAVVMGQEVLVGEHPFPEPTVDLLLEMLGAEQEPHVLQSIGVAFGHLHDPRCIGPLTALRTHEDEAVRHAVVMGLLRHDDDMAVAALVELSRDADPGRPRLGDVRPRGDDRA